MGATIAEGRAFTPFDNADNAGVVVVNESFAKRYLTPARAVGQIVRIHATGIGPLGLNLKASGPRAPDGMPFEVVGVVNDVRNVPLGQAIEPAMYFSTRQFPFSEVFLAVKATDRNAAITAVREGLRRAAPNVPMAAVQTWGERFAKRTAEPRLLMTILVCFGVLAALLAAIGVYGLFSWSVALRTRELAIRLTLGAKPASVGSLVVRQSAVLVVAGLIVGRRDDPRRARRAGPRRLRRVAERCGFDGRGDGGAARRGARSPASRRRSARCEWIRWKDSGQSSRHSR